MDRNKKKYCVSGTNSSDEKKQGWQWEMLVIVIITITSEYNSQKGLEEAILRRRF